MFLARSRIMDTRQLKIFTEVYRTRSFTKAAEVLFTSQPTISEHMRNFEDSLGCKLFDRLGRSILPTPEAEFLYPKAVELLEEMDKVGKMMASVSNSVSGELHVGASTIPGAYLLPQCAAAFKTRYPGVSFKITINDSAQILKMIEDNHLYMGIVGARIASGKVNYSSFGEDELVLTVPADSELPDKILPAELKKLNFLIREDGSGTAKTIEHFLSRFDIATADLNVSGTLGSSTAVKEAVKAGLGVSILSKLAVRDELGQGLLREVGIEGLEMKRTFYIATPQRRTLPNHYLLFIESLN